MINQILMASAGAIGFGAIFGLPRKKLHIVGVFEMFARSIYLLLVKLLRDNGTAMFVITIIIVLISKLMTHRLKCPTFIIATPVLIPFIPGATLYLVMSDFVANRDTLMINLELLLEQAGAIIAGNLVAEMLYREQNRSSRG